MITKKTFIALCSLLLSISVASAMSYHDNKVEFKNADAEEAIKGSFVISNYKITKGQDPDHKNAIGNIVKFRDSKLNFEVGRKSSSEVADWVLEQVSNYQLYSSAGGSDKDMNFAFLGDLNITLNGDRYILNDMMIIQFNQYSANHWMVGGKNCEYKYVKEKSSYQLMCETINLSKNRIENLAFFANGQKLFGGTNKFKIERV